MKLSWDKALEKLDEAFAIVVDNNELLYHGYDIGENYSGVYFDSEHQGTRVEFSKSANKNIEVDKDGQLQLKSENGDMYSIGLLVRKPLNKHPITGKVKA